MEKQAFIKLASDPESAYIDIDTYGITLIRGWREALLTPPAVKEYITNESRLQDGVSVIAKPEYAKKAKREISLSFYLEGQDETDYLQKYEAFLNKIAYKGEFYLKVPCLGRVFKLVYSQCSQYGDYGLKRSKFTLKLTEYNPNDRPEI